MLEGMLLAIVIIALAQLPWLVWLYVRERPQPGGGGGGSKRGQDPPHSPPEPSFNWDAFETDFRAFARSPGPVIRLEDDPAPAADPSGRTEDGGALSG